MKRIAKKTPIKMPANSTILYFHRMEPELLDGPGSIPGGLMGGLERSRIKATFIITSRPVRAASYRLLIDSLRSKGISTSSEHIEEMSPGALRTVERAAGEIIRGLDSGNVLILSYGQSRAHALLACTHIMAGRSVHDALERARAASGELIVSHEDASFIRLFHEHLKGHPVRAFDLESLPLPPAGLTEDAAPLGKILDAVEAQPREHKAKKKAGGDIPSAPKAAAAEIQEKSSDGLKAGREPKPPETAEAATGVAEKASPKPARKKQKEADEEAAPVFEKRGPFYRSLRFKLVSIISLIIIAALSGMILLATYFFKKDNRVRAEMNNHKISEVTALKAGSDLESIMKRSQIIASSGLAGRAAAANPLDEDEEILFEGSVRPGKGGAPELALGLYNERLMEQYQIGKEGVEAAIAAGGKTFARAFEGETVVSNVSPIFGAPVLSLCLPFARGEEGAVKSILICYIRLDSMQKAFQARGEITRSFMVNDAGDVIAHPDSAIVVAGANYAELPIVKMMMTSRIDNGQTRYRDEKGVFFLGSFRKIGIGGCGVVSTVEESLAFREVYNIQRRNIYLMVIVITLVVMIIFYFGRSITTPIVKLVGATKKIKEGRYDIKIKPTTRDEIGELTSSFIEMGRGLEEREKIKSAFGKFVNKEVAEAAMRDELALGGERKVIAVLFSDIRDFTAIAEDLEPEEVVAFLNEYMTLMVRCVNDSYGVVDKFIGDAIMAVWGTPVSRGNDTENAINGALAMRRALAEYNADRGGSGKPRLRIGIGISTGPVLAGQIGSEDRMEYTVIGDTVNLASRIEQLNKAFATDILISEDSYDAVKREFAVVEMPPIRVKGKDEPQRVFAVLGRLDDVSRPKSIEELRALLGVGPPSAEKMRSAVKEEEVKYEILKN